MGNNKPLRLVSVILTLFMLVSTLEVFPSVVYAAAFNIGDTVEVYNSGASGLLVRDSPSGTIIGGKFDGDRGVVLDVPVYSNNYSRWKIRWLDGGLVGWSAEDWLRKVSQPIEKYNRQAAVDYAIANAVTANETYKDFNLGRGGGDCTNFVSQALLAGGWTMISGPKDSPTSWFYRRSGIPIIGGLLTRWSLTWSVADNLAKFIELSGRGKRVNIIRGDKLEYMNLQVGDLVQYTSEKGDRMEHSMIITDKNQNDLYVSYHSPGKGNNKKDVALSEIMDRHPDRNFYGWSLY